MNNYDLADRDWVSRQAAIDVMCELMHHWFGGDPKDEIREIKRELEKLPSAQPDHATCYLDSPCEYQNSKIALPSAQPEQRWIPVSEGLPKEYGEYICTMENGQVQECGFVPENQRGLVDGWSTCEADGHKFLGYADVLAWMPRPKPWKEGEA